MNIHAITDVPEDFKHMMENAEAFGEAMRDPQRSEIVQTWLGKDKKSNRGEIDAESNASANKRSRDAGAPPGTYAKADPEENQCSPKMETIIEGGGKKKSCEYKGQGCDTPRGQTNQDPASHRESESKGG